MKKILIYLIAIVFFTACNEEKKCDMLPPTTDVKCTFNTEKEKCGSHHNQSFVEGIPYGVIGLEIKTRLSDVPNAPEVENYVLFKEKGPYVHDGIVLEGVYVGNNDIKIRLLTKFYPYNPNKWILPNENDEIEFNDIIPTYESKELKGVNITHNKSLNLGTFKPTNSAIRITFVRDLNDKSDTKYHIVKNGYLHCKFNVLDRQGSSITSDSIYMNDKYLGEGNTQTGVFIHNYTYNRRINITILCKDHLNKTIGYNKLEFIPGKCLVKTYTKKDFITP